MFDDSRAFVTRPFLRAELDLDYRAYLGEGQDEILLARLREWDRRLQLSETQAEGAFTQTFFVDTWGYGESGRVGEDEHTIIPKLRIAGEGAGGGPGEADLALGWFRGKADATPQVLCEFKDIRSKLDAKQNRKGSNRSPVEQCLNYVRGARRGLFGNEPVQPWWGLVTDMNEFRLYWWDRAPQEYLRFVIRRDGDLFAGDYDLLGESDEARFDRFLFWKLFQRDMLISQAGRPALLRLIERQWVRERRLEGEFYERYKAVRERLYNVLSLNNPMFDGTKTELLRLSQALLDRFIFAFYCEDMGERMLFPPQMIRDHMKTRSVEAYYDPNGQEFWAFFKTLFGKMNDGGEIGLMRVPHINGGLFAPNPGMDALAIPNHVFAAPRQGASEAALEGDPDTLLYLCARYNYASRGAGRESLSLYTLGRIFEQSITELEYRAGEIEGRESIAELTKRKRDGVYYTPEWVVNLLVEQTMGPWFADAKAAAGYPSAEGAVAGPAEAQAYRERLRSMRIVDPACGSGAFLISAFRRLLQERVTAERDVRRAHGSEGEGVVEESPLIADILTNNIYGVDINPASVEIAKLALWLHSARADAPLSSLDHTIRCGNSLVDHDFWAGRERLQDRHEAINSFDWEEAFPEAWPEDGVEGGFDVVLGNPPYVKLQNLMKVDPEVVAYLQEKRGDDTYRSALTGNTDLYLPFIEKGLRLLAPGGRMAYIAPSLWAVNQYGEGLRRLVRRTRQLDRWLDFKAYQVFDEAITYTALQFFTHEAREAVRIAAAPEGDTQAHDVDWSDADLAVPYAALPEDGEWLMATGAERRLIDRLARDCWRLDDARLTKDIFQGVKTGADPIYKLKRVGSDKYQCDAEGSSFVADIEDELMHPIISGPEAKRYLAPETDVFLLFPYTSAGHLLPTSVMQQRYPKAWAYLTKWRHKLTKRDGGKLNDHDWYRFSRAQSLNRAETPKLFAAGTVPNLRFAADESGRFFLTGGRVDGIVPASGEELWYLLGVLNGKLADFVFRRIGRPKQGGWYEANKQFIAPLPVPDASPEDRADVAARARALQERWTRRRDLLAAAGERLSVLARASHPLRFLWPDLPDLPAMIERAPAALKNASDRRKWADDKLTEMEAARIEELQAALDGGGAMEAAFADGELTLSAGGAAVLSKIYLGEQAGRLAEAHWRFVFLSREWRDAGRLAAELRRPPAEADSAAVSQFIERVEALAAETEAIEDGEREMNELLFRLYALTAEERLLVESGGETA